MHNPEKYSPRKVDFETIQKGVSKRVMDKVTYECNLLRCDPKYLFTIASHLFRDDLPDEVEPVTTKHEESNHEDTTINEHYGEDYSPYQGYETD